MKYIETDPYTQGGYHISNESPRKHAALIKGLKFRRVAAICAGGEVGLTIYGPHCDELFLFDVDPSCLKRAALKLNIIKKNPVIDIRYHLYRREGRIDHITNDIPFAIRPNDIYTEPATALTHWWERITLDDLAALKNLVPKVTFVHGDIRDVTQFGKFDLIYTSNAYQAQRKKRVHLNDFIPAMRLGSYLVTTEDFSRDVQKNFDSLKKLRYNDEPNDEDHWTYTLWTITRIPEEGPRNPFPTPQRSNVSYNLR